ncbi:LysR family transcriptional regulator [Dickeya dianthicola]|uniref:LysR family transcriptional regulator n=1 Tax=Dickeya dianthicola TaxID=204039 RepID=UPI00136F22F6|nr:LysR family transcriptional regulator [Dickeya dianthicola]MCI4235749.1 LysR family transcriptional regulator [Dickeya dianthicola]MCI4255598.1 LysR family transcriptional regulator [Dickeya dianthicola]MZG22720.1 LysR family transcriptional regulator [Dickeya dianthicola]MZI87729.1 LysR family transcriptional regulator [Dickeya dianthicola]
MDRITAAQVFVAITEQGSLTGAAQALEMSRAMVTRYLAEMERWAEARLLHRSTRQLSLTSEGETVLRHCRELLTVSQKLETPARGRKEPSGLMRLTCSPSLAQTTLVAAITAYLLRYPKTAIDLQVASHTLNLIEERIDLAIRITSQLDSGLIARRLGGCPSIVCAAPSYLAEHGTPQRVEDLAVHNCLTYSFFGKSLWRFSHKGETVAIPVSGSFSANDSLMLLEAALNGAGISLQPVYSVTDLIANKRLIALFPEAQPQELDIYAVYHSRERMPSALRALVDFLAQWFDSNLEWKRVSRR